VAESRLFQDEAIERMVLDAFDEMCGDAGIEGAFAEEGPMSLALVPDPLRLGAVVDLWMRIESREESARQAFAERTTILGSHLIDVTPDQDDDLDEELDEEYEEEGEDQGEASVPAETAAGEVNDHTKAKQEDEEEYEETVEPLLDELELRGRLLVDVVNAVGQQLSERRGALEMGEELPTLAAVREAILEALNITFEDERLEDLWSHGVLISSEEA
jgi:hypothetical protein